MKLITLFVLLISSSIYANTPAEELSYDQCYDRCQSTGHHTYQRHGRFSICHDVMNCEILKWNDDLDSCELIGEEIRKVPMQCRDIPPAF